MSKEYEELREKIARKICELDRRNWDVVDDESHSVYCQRADEILSIIADKCWLKTSASVNLTPTTSGNPTFADNDTTFQHLTEAFHNAGWRPVKPIEKP